MIPPRYVFFLGGHDLEMVTIAELLHERQSAGDPRVAEICDKGLPWGARASDYRSEIAAAAARGLSPVLVELTCDMPLPPGCFEIDHHGPRSAEPAALRQVFTLLDLPESLWTRDFELVAANDIGHIPALERFGATTAEIAEIRRRDRQAQGITAEEEAQGLAALAQAETALAGSLIVITLPHGRTATVADPLVAAGDRRDLLILCPDTVQFFGAGARIARLDAAFPGGWRGGELPRRGFWGLAASPPLPALLAALG
ncbi:hypothetical protein H9N28_16370 [Rhodobacter capsulatus]|uniref:hypothetical protein n=1 Tax=Rhodobacter capsulatus TaxID=1061 RepID=UPI0006DCE0F7|nr:hypothetical protein [Rhodobacter capsulatus]KQB14187.1 hypothetical protein AP073_15670 [Rhodobacter capsulatus]KQB14211.1 hypothetical protein AP071_15770 [Rhodobacter capsulatus]PZX22256.1 hypothetical protein LY44_02984 [Rhodobacter capsulatus]QNR63092.1 hypothetical protein H9N28_16370 [Rhodobacter capsulatus]